MKKLLSLLTLAVGLFVFTSCDDEVVPPNGYIETTEDGAQTVVLKGYISKAQGFSTLEPKGFAPIYLSEKRLFGKKYDFILCDEVKLSDMTQVPVDGDWKSDGIQVFEHTTYWARYAGASYQYIKLRVAYIDGNNVGVEYVISDVTTARPNSNSNLAFSNEGAWGLEIPHLNADYYFAPHYVTFEGSKYMNLAIEWSAELKHSNWVAFSYDKNTSRTLVDRGNNWVWDPEIPTDKGMVEEAQHKSDGYDKGHLCASSDRLYSTEANDQTFYYSNVSPMLHNFNTGFWTSIEEYVRNWGRSTKSGTYDKVYVTKGGTLNKLIKNLQTTKKGNDGIIPTTDANGLTKHGLAVPAYYFVAVLAEKDGTYQALGFLVEHDDNLSSAPSKDQIRAKVVSIDKLEEVTGIDFFCNLDDAIESEVEATVNDSKWAW